MYTNVLRAIIRLSTLVFPENLSASEIDALARSSVWDSHNDYPQITGHGIGSFLSVQECKFQKMIIFFSENSTSFFQSFIAPIKISYAEPHKYSFKEGYFFTNGESIFMTFNLEKKTHLNLCHK